MLVPPRGSGKDTAPNVTQSLAVTVPVNAFLGTSTHTIQRFRIFFEARILSNFYFFFSY